MTKYFATSPLILRAQHYAAGAELVGVDPAVCDSLVARGLARVEATEEPRAMRRVKGKVPK